MACLMFTYIRTIGDAIWLEEIFYLLKSFSHKPNLKAMQEVENFKKHSLTQHISELENISETRKNNH